MTTRTTKKDVALAFARFLEATGRRAATSHNDVGGLRLDYAACYGGYNIEEISTKTGAVSHPFGGDRVPAYTMYKMLHFAAFTAEQAKK